MDKIERLVENIYERRICNEFDHVIPVVGDEGMGKSTLILQLAILYQQKRDGEADPDEILNSIIHDREELKEALASFERRSIIAVPDAARVLHRKEAMKGEQVEIEKDFFDVRTKEFLILLGFQDWNTIPTFLQERRAKNVLYIPRRGLVRGYNRESLDERVGANKWPPADMHDTFPALDGTDIWEQYQQLDRAAKDSRMQANQEEEAEAEEEGVDLFDVAERIKANGIDEVVSIHAGNKSRYIDQDLIEVKYDLNAQQARKVKKLLASDSDVQVDQKATA